MLCKLSVYYQVILNVKLSLTPWRAVTCTQQLSCQIIREQSIMSRQLVFPCSLCIQLCRFDFYFVLILLAIHLKNLYCIWLKTVSLINCYHFVKYLTDCQHLWNVRYKCRTDNGLVCFALCLKMAAYIKWSQLKTKELTKRCDNPRRWLLDTAVVQPAHLDPLSFVLGVCSIITSYSFPLLVLSFFLPPTPSPHSFLFNQFLCFLTLANSKIDIVRVSSSPRAIGQMPSVSS